MKSVSALKTDIINLLWPSGAPENLLLPVGDEGKSAFDKLFDAAFSEISKWVPSEQLNNVDVIPACATWFKCGQTVIKCPKGVVHRVGTVLTGAFCDPVWYREVDWPATEWAGNKLLSLYKTAELVTVPAPTLPLGFSKFDASTDATYRAETGIWAKHQKNIYLAPWIQSTESIVVEWDGIKNTWANDDLVPDTEEYKKAVLLYFQYQFEYYYGSNEKALLIHNPQKTGTFDEALGDLMWQDRNETKRRISRMDPDRRGVIVPQTPADAGVEADETELTLTDKVTGTVYTVTITDGQLALTAAE